MNLKNKYYESLGKIFNTGKNRKIIESELEEHIETVSIMLSAIFYLTVFIIFGVVYASNQASVTK